MSNGQDARARSSVKDSAVAKGRDGWGDAAAQDVVNMSRCTAVAKESEAGLAEMVERAHGKRYRWYLSRGDEELAHVACLETHSATR